MPPGLLGQMTTVGTTGMPLGLCPSCARALIYGAITYAGASKDSLAAAQSALDGRRSCKPALEALEALDAQLDAVLKLLVQFVHADFESCLPAGTSLDQDDWTVAIDAFLRSRLSTYVTDDGQIAFEPHEHDEPDTDRRNQQ
jgi:hypothetical protein